MFGGFCRPPLPEGNKPTNVPIEGSEVEYKSKCSKMGTTKFDPPPSPKMLHSSYFSGVFAIKSNVDIQ
jgi:hypothetical protein